MPHLVELAKKNKDRGLVVIGVHTTGSGEKMPEFVQQEGIDYPVAIDVDNKTKKAFAVDSYPDYYLIDRQGVLRVADLANGGVDAAIGALLAEPGPRPKAKDAKDTKEARPDAEALFASTLEDAKKTGRKVLVHVHGPG